VEIGQERLPSFFIRDASCLKAMGEILHFDLASKSEKATYSEKILGDAPVTVGITAGASCPNNLIEATILRVFELRGVDRAAVLAA
jgi:4-hydroxy-3-methylbut-2-enyl diphosphate reductase